jgi:general secretion pathway protein L
MAALPYAVEEAFAEDVERLHFAMGRRSDDGVTEALAIEKPVLDALVAEFDRLNWWPDSLTADFLALPETSSGSVLMAADGWRLRLPDTSQDRVCAMTLDAPLARLAIEQWATHDQQTDALAIWQAGDPNTRDTDLDMQATRVFPSLLDALIAGGHAGIHLLSGRYRPRSRQKARLKKFKPLIGAAAAFALLAAAWLTTDILLLKKQVEQIREAQRQLFTQVFPGSKPRAPYREMKARLRAAGTSAGDTAGLLPLLVRFYQARKSVQDVDVRSLQYRAQKDELQIDVSVPDYASLETLQKALAEQGLQVDPVSATRTGDRYSGRLVFRGEAS